MSDIGDFRPFALALMLAGGATAASAGPVGVPMTLVEAKLLAPAAAQTPPVNDTARVMAEFKARVGEYDAIRNKLSGTLPKLPDAATPQQIDSNQRQLAALIVAARTGAKQGDLFTPDIQAVVRTLMAQVFKERQTRTELRASIAEENPRGIKIAVNGRYPDAVPLTTMPPSLLKNLPPLPDEMEYRFVGDSLILLDARSQLVVDYMSAALPPA